jgi:hypothetical protein
LHEVELLRDKRNIRIAAACTHSIEHLHISLFDVGQDRPDPGDAHTVAGICWEVNPITARRQGVHGIVMVVQSQGDLFDVVLALQASRRLPRRLHRRQQQRDQNADDRDDHEQLNEREPGFGLWDWGFADLTRIGCDVSFHKPPFQFVSTLCSFQPAAVKS